MLEASTICDRLMQAANACDPGYLTYEETEKENLRRARDRAANLRHLADLAREHCRSAALDIAEPVYGVKSKYRVRDDNGSEVVPYVSPKDAPADWWKLPTFRIELPREVWKRIIRDVSRKHSIPPHAIQSRSRDVSITKARHEAMWRIRTETSLSLPQICNLMGVGDHTTVLHGVRRHQARIDGGEEV